MNQVSANGKGFMRGLGWWFVLALPSTYTNAMASSLPTSRKQMLITSRFGSLNGNWHWHSEQISHDTSMTCTCESCSRPQHALSALNQSCADLRRNENLNYYKFGLGLGMLTATPTIEAGKRVEGGPAEAAAGGADQSVVRCT